MPATRTVFFTRWPPARWALSPLWTDEIAEPDGTSGECVASAVWNATDGTLYAGGGGTTIRGTSYGGSIDEINPATGAYVWQRGLPCRVVGTPTLDSAGVLAVGTYTCTAPSTPTAYLINAANGAILTTLPVGSTKVFGQPVFAQGALFVATESNGLYDLAP